MDTARGSMSPRASESETSIPGARRGRRRAFPTRSRRPSALASTHLLALGVVSALIASASAQTDCAIPGAAAIFMVYQAEIPDAVFFSEDGCLAGGGRGNGCCPGSKCEVCEPNTVQSTGGKEMRWNSCVCEPCEPGTAQFRVGMRTCEACPEGWYQLGQGQTQCEPCPPGTFNSQVARSTPCEKCPPGTYSSSDIRAYREATTKTYRGVGTSFDPSTGASRCAVCPAGTFQPEFGGRSPEECQECPPGFYSESGASECVACPAGTYQPRAGRASERDCLPCAAGMCSDADASVECYQCCPVANLACDAYLKRARGFYGQKAWYSNDGEIGRVPTDRKDEFLERLCARGCREYGVVNWCVTGVCAA